MRHSEVMAMGNITSRVLTHKMYIVVAHGYFETYPGCEKDASLGVPIIV